ncbi:TOBE domain-containing protein [Sodalinema gerasimenkoae]|uniref:TOBE domain-containing protein n=1 Tax=Sodalinema gerasimenkoae TaxID=2862348 RepID=UPI00135CEF4E|nr:TOBE domain-containing protein [Sodalinema gerasimenkoae]
MQATANKVLKGTIKHISLGSVNAEVTLEINPGVEITAMVTTASVDKLQLSQGKEAYAIIQASQIMISVD